MENKENVRFFLFPAWCKWLGVLFIVICAVSGYVCLYGKRPDFLDSKIFAFFSYYLRDKSFTLVKNNLLDEVCAISALVGLMLLNFSKISGESEETKQIRIRILFLSTYITIAVWALAFLFVYGWPIIGVSAGVFPFFLIVNFLLTVLKLSQHKKLNVD